ncbi:MAG: nuclear transport factor 2 family protein, partial [Steroidobacteraceae bacterium]|nr:nuclear transport factor 2 family protein [Steroidobacteraceae bacterium]
MFRTLPIAGVALMALALSAGRSFASDESARDLHERVNRLEATVRAQEAVRAVKRIQHTYAHYLESGLWSDLADLFTQDAIAEFPTGIVRGRSQLRRHFMQQAERASPGLANGQLHVHLIMQPIVNVSADGRSVMGTWHEMAMLGRFGSSASWRGGVYENEYTLENGVWKISRLRYFEQYRGAYDDFGHKAPPAWKIPYHFEASHVGVTIPANALESLARESSAGADSERVGALARRVQRLSDETEVRNLQHSFGYYLDRKMWDDVADLFAKDGSLELASRGVYIGRERIRRALEVFYGPSPLRYGELFDHIQLGTVVTVSADGRSAAARTMELRMLGVNGEYAQWEVGTYENQFVREEGVWKLKAVRYFPRMATDYDEGWARDAKPAPGPVNEFPPDRPSARHESYPVAYVVGVHYRNPATGRAVR